MDVCTKCGKSGEFERRYWHTSLTWKLSPDAKECLIVKCCACGFEWDEPCKDAVPSAELEQER